MNTIELPVINPVNGLSPRNLAKLARHAPSGPLALVRTIAEFGPVTRFGNTYFVADHRLVSQMLRKHAADMPRGRQYDNIEPIVGRGLLTIDDATHRQRRPIMNPAFRHAHVMSHVAGVAREALAMVEPWRAGQRLTMQSEARGFTIRSAAQSLSHASPDAQLLALLDKNFPTFLNGVNIRGLLPSGVTQHLPGNHAFYEAQSAIRGALEQLIADRIAKSAEVDAENPENPDLISMMLAGGLTTEEITHEGVTMIVAATASTVSTLTFALRAIGDSPEIAAKFYAEIDEVLGDGPITPENLGKLTFTYQLMDEVLRHDTPPWLLGRRTTTDVTLSADEIGRVSIPADRQVFFSLWAIHNDPSVYPDPEKFDPERWAIGCTRPPKSAWMPFGAGRRMCIGESFVRMEVPIALAIIGQRWTVESVSSVPAAHKTGGTLHPDNTEMIVWPRDNRDSVT